MTKRLPFSIVAPPVKELVPVRVQVPGPALMREVRPVPASAKVRLITLLAPTKLPPRLRLRFCEVWPLVAPVEPVKVRAPVPEDSMPELPGARVKSRSKETGPPT